MGALKDDLHNLIDSTTDEQLLEDIFMILSGRNDYKAGQIWENLTEEQKQETLKSAGVMNDDAAWEDHEDLKQKNGKWLK